jgi:hypothetical protein
MSQLVVSGAPLACSFGLSPSSLVVAPANKTNGGGPPAANIMDFVPTTNIPPFGMCTSMLNPQVAAATASALGVLTPQPCIPVTTTPWAPGAPTVLIGGQPALNDVSVCMCTWLGVITISQAGQLTIKVP